jgi:hypothetical protein
MVPENSNLGSAGGYLNSRHSKPTRNVPRAIQQRWRGMNPLADGCEMCAD